MRKAPAFFSASLNFTNAAQSAENVRARASTNLIFTIQECNSLHIDRATAPEHNLPDVLGTSGLSLARRVISALRSNASGIQIRNSLRSIFL
jgi:hypothetical protein